MKDSSEEFFFTVSVFVDIQSVLLHHQNATKLHSGQPNRSNTVDMLKKATDRTVFILVLLPAANRSTGEKLRAGVSGE